MKKLMAWLKGDRSILRGAVVLGGGAAVGQVILIASTPIISRIYSPGEIGLLALYLSFISVAITIAPLGFQRAIPSASTREEAATLVVGVLLYQPVMCVLLALAQWPLMQSGYLGFDTLPKYTIFLSGFSILANTLLFTLQFWYIRSESYPIISRVQVFQNLGRAGLQIILGFIGLGLFGLIAGDFTGRLLGLGSMLRQSWDELIQTVRPFKLQRFLTVFKKFRKFLFPQLPSIVTNTIARMLPVPLLVYYYGVEAAGLYAMVDRIMQVSVAFVSKSLGNALHGRIGHYSRTNPERIMSVFLKSSGGLLLVGILPTLVLVFWGEILFTFALGDQWNEAGKIATLVAPWSLATLIVSTSSRVVYIFQAFYTEFLYNIVSLVFVVGVFLVGHQQGWGMILTVTWLARLGVLAYLFYYLLLVIIVRRGIREFRQGTNITSQDQQS